MSTTENTAAPGELVSKSPDWILAEARAHLAAALSLTIPSDSPTLQCDECARRRECDGCGDEFLAVAGVIETYCPACRAALDEEDDPFGGDHFDTHQERDG